MEVIGLTCSYLNPMKEPQYPPNRRLGWPHSRSELYREKKSLGPARIQTVQSVESCCTDYVYAVPVLVFLISSKRFWDTLVA
jgi:hypothetical protein